MARNKINDNLNEPPSGSSGSENVAVGGNGEIPASDIRQDEGDIINPGEVSGDSGGTSEPWFPKRNKRGRKVRASKETTADLNGLLWMVHQGLSSLTGIEELALDPAESKELAEAVARVQAFYPTSVLSPVAMAWTGLIVTAGKVYGTRVIAYTARKKTAKGPQAVETLPFPPGTTKAAAGEM